MEYSIGGTDAKCLSSLFINIFIVLILTICADKEFQIC